MESWFGTHKYILLGDSVEDQKNQKTDKSGGFFVIGVNDSGLRLIPLPTTKRKPVIILVLDKDIQVMYLT